jgi:hypothetical protein
MCTGLVRRRTSNRGLDSESDCVLPRRTPHRANTADRRSSTDAPGRLPPPSGHPCWAMDDRVQAVAAPRRQLRGAAPRHAACQDGHGCRRPNTAPPIGQLGATVVRRRCLVCDEYRCSVPTREARIRVVTRWSDCINGHMGGRIALASAGLQVSEALTTGL